MISAANLTKTIAALASLFAAPLAQADTSGEGTASNRLAVVIGNQDYAAVTDLKNPRRDAERMSGTLRRLGFQVFDAYDLDRRGFEDLLNRAMLNASEDSDIVFFYAGHGIQIGRRNYLLPTNASFESVYDLPVQGVTLDRIIDELATRGQVHVAIIDACRDNPFPAKMLAGNLDAELFETRPGFDVFRTPLNSLVAFGTSPGMVAFDGAADDHSPYTKAILETLDDAPEQEVLSMFARVRERVYDATDGQQVPWESSTLIRPFTFAADAAGAAGETAVADSGADGGEARGAAAGAPDLPQVLPGDLPDRITLNAEYDRAIDLGPLIAAALGTDTPPPVAMTAQPEGGVIAAGSGNVELFYRPKLSPRRAEGTEASVQDSFALDLGTGPGTGAASKTVNVDLALNVNACDLAAGDALDPAGVGFYRLPNEIPIGQALSACATAVQRAPEVARFRHQLARAQLAARDYDAAYDNYQAAIEMGHVRSLAAVARLLTAEQVDRDVYGIPFDPDRARGLLEDGTTAGDPFAMHLLGRTLLREGGTDAERERGFELLDRAAELGHTYSMNELGIYFLTKDSAHFLPERGMKYLEASAARGDIYGYHNIGFVELYGLADGVADPEAAYEWFEKAALGGHPKSPATLGRMIVRDQVAGKSVDAALDWYDMALKRGDGWGGVNAAQMILGGDVAGYETPGALIRAAKALHLPDAEAAGEAEAILARAGDADLGRAVQAFLNEFGSQVTVDGQIGPQTLGVVRSLLDGADLTSRSERPADLLSALARLYWVRNPLRSDLF